MATPVITALLVLQIFWSCLVVGALLGQSMLVMFISWHHQVIPAACAAFQAISSFYLT